MMAFIVIPWFVLELTGSATRLGLTVAVGALPIVIAGVFGGVFVDRLGFKRMSVVADLASGLTVGMIPLLYHTVGITFWQLLVLVFLGALLDTPGYTARMSLYPELTKLAGMRLERVNATAETLSRLALLGGPPIAGLLIAVFGTTTLLWAKSAAFAISAVLVAVAIPSTLAVARPSEPFSVRNYVRELGEGASFIRRDRLIFAVIMTLAATNFLQGGIIVGMPVYANEILGRALDLGLMFSVLGGGAVVGAVAFGVVGHRLPRGLMFIGGFTLISCLLWIMALTPPLWVVLGALLVVGIAVGPIDPLLNTIYQERTPQEIRGRVFGLIDATAFIAVAPGRLFAGYMIERFGVALALAIVGTGYVLMVLGMFLNPALRDMSRTGAVSPSPSEPVSAVGDRFG